jgi:hypothetical protein
MTPARLALMTSQAIHAPAGSPGLVEALLSEQQRPDRREEQSDREDRTVGPFQQNPIEEGAIVSTLRSRSCRRRRCSRDEMRSCATRRPPVGTGWCADGQVAVGDRGRSDRADRVDVEHDGTCSEAASRVWLDLAGSWSPIRFGTGSGFRRHFVSLPLAMPQTTDARVIPCDPVLLGRFLYHSNVVFPVSTPRCKRTFTGLSSNRANVVAVSALLITLSTARTG